MMSPLPDVASLILAAGRSTRMQRPKALLGTADGTTFIAHLARLYGWWGHLVVVVNSQIVRSVLDELRNLEPAGQSSSVSVLINPHPEEGLFSSVLLGLRQVRSSWGEVRHVLVTPVDCVLPSRDAPEALLSAARCGNTGPVLVPVFGGTRGHPVLVRRSAFDTLLAHPPSAVFSEVLEQLGVCEVPVEDPSVLLNLNTPEEYRQFVNTTRKGEER